MNFAQLKRKYLRSSEEVISMFLGLVIVVVVGGLIFNYFQRNKGLVDIPGSSSEISLGGEKEEVDNGSYEVLLGDSLWKIATEKYGSGYAWTEIAKINNLKNPSVLEVGQKLLIPDKVVIGGEELVLENPIPENESSLISQGASYKVVKGDSLWQIAVRAYSDGYQWVKIWQKNKSKLPNANGLEIGMMLEIPKLN